MTYIERLLEDTDVSFSHAIQESYAASFSEALPAHVLGSLIKCSGRSFQEVRLAGVREKRMVHEDRIFLSFKSKSGRAALQLGSMHGLSFVSPPQPGAEVVARLVKNGSETMVEPFFYEQLE